MYELADPSEHTSARAQMIEGDGETFVPGDSPASYFEEGLRSGVFGVIAQVPGSSEFEMLDGFSIGFNTADDTSMAGEASPTPSARRLPAAILDGSNREQRRDYVASKENWLSTDVDSIWNKSDRVLAIGDQHMTLGGKQHLIDNMKAYKAAGAEGIGMEFFPKRSQPDLERYYALRRDPGADPDAVAQARLKVQNLFSDAQESPDDTEEARQAAQPAMDKLMDIVDAAIDAGIRLVAIEPNISKSFATDGGYQLLHAGMRNLSASSEHALQTYTDPTASAEQRQRAREELQSDLERPDASFSQPAAKFFAALDEAREAGLDFNDLKLPRGAESEDKEWNARLHDVRNRTWAQQASEFLTGHKNPHARMLMFAGAQHFQYGQREGVKIPSANERMDMLGIGATVLQFAGGDFAQHAKQEADNAAEFYALQNDIQKNDDGSYPPAPDHQQTPALLYTTAAQEAGAADQLFAIRIARTGPRGADYIIHLPQS